MNQALFVDTNFLCAIYNKDDSLHKKAEHVIPNITQFSLVTSNFVLLESYTVISQRKSKNDAITFKNDVCNKRSYQIIWIDKEFEKDVWNIFTSIKDKDFSYADASILAVMQKEKIHHLLSFDTLFVPLQKRFQFELIGALQ